ncbi:MAG: prepilin-type N-terminal cleavage/methylation domain-containing protein [Planctomycetota bacterium]|nr:prepilin-type N-terminal cleavage/methylation domain-containing protein [Planctomycetota bacterium]
MNRLPTTASLSSKHTARGAIPQPAPRPASPPVRAGFTLVEMLVAVALVILMMTLFASIFQLATGAMSTQRGLAENDQRSRLVLNSLRYDLSHRTMQYVLPFAANEDVSQPEARLALRRGYLYIREGDPDDTADDLLQFTIDVKSDDRIYGVWGKPLSASGQLGDLLMVDANGKFGDTTNNPYWLNQPEFDDGTNDIDHATSSTLAEVSYFLRNGGLYRRVLLIRQPSTSTATGSGQPMGTQGPLKTELFENNGYNGAFENFWSCSDFSAFFDLTNQSLKFHGAASLDNGVGGSQSVLANPKFRFGHRVLDGAPREVSSNGYYIGRFTHQETSSFDPTDRSKGFGYPGRSTVGSRDPFNPSTQATYNVNTGVIEEYKYGWRVAEDLLMTNVHRFDIKVWDPAASMGPDGAPGRAGIDDDGNKVFDFVSPNAQTTATSATSATRSGSAR